MLQQVPHKFKHISQILLANYVQYLLQIDRNNDIIGAGMRIGPHKTQEKCKEEEK